MEKYKIFVGVDISKSWIDVAILSDNLTAHRNYGNNKKEFKLMLSWLKTFARPSEMLLCMENTGVYTMPLWEYLVVHKIATVVENALQINRSMGIRRGKSDKADAQVIARYIKLHHTECRLFKAPTELITRLKVLFSYRERLLKTKHQLWVASKEIQGFVSADLSKEMIHDSDALIKNIGNKIDKAEKLILGIIMSDSEAKRIYKLITSIPGIGLITATYLIIVTQNFTIIENSRKLSRYGGMSPEKNDSGIVKRKAHVSPIGNKKLKSLLSNCVGTNLKYDSESKEYYNRKILEGKHEGIVINNLKNKILHRVYSCE
ncbi:MAG TPA: transposase [Chitinophagaceae bacterium]|nr:transposase [Chitinophagaceae bacterium]